MRQYFHTVPFGCVEIDGDKVLRQEEKPRIERTVNAGIYVLDPALLGRIPRTREFPLPALIDECLERGELVRAYPIADDWIDIGQEAQLKQARDGAVG